MIELLTLFDWYGINERIDFAKGSHKIPESMSDGAKQIKRVKKWQSKKQ